MIYYGMISLIFSPWPSLNYPSLCSRLTDADVAHFHISLSERSDFIEEVTTELSVYLGMLYHLIEVFKGHDDFADELSEHFHRD